jgi:type II secretory pathway predicted ATPase ExeA
MTSVQTPEGPMREQPFEPLVDALSLWLGEQQKAALATLQAAVLQAVDLLILTGEAGTGKTMLANALVDGLRREGMIIGTLPCPRPEPFDLLRGVANAYALPSGAGDREGVLVRFAAFLREAQGERKKVLLVIDDAQTLARGLFREIEHLAEIGKRVAHEGVNPLGILLVGRPDLISILQEPDNANLLRRVNIRFRLSPLNKEEVGDYIRWRLEAAGIERRLFTPGAIQQAWALSGGSLRLIDEVCGRAMREAQGQGALLVAAEIFREWAGASRQSNEGSLRRPPDTARRPLRGAAAGRLARRRAARRVENRRRPAAVFVVSLVAGLGLALAFVKGPSREVPGEHWRGPSADESVHALAEPRAREGGFQGEAAGFQGEIAPVDLDLGGPAATPSPATAGGLDSALPAPTGSGVKRSPRIGGPAVAAKGGSAPSPSTSGVLGEATAGAGPTPRGSTSPHEARAQNAEAGPIFASGTVETRGESDSTAIIDWLLQDNRRRPD